MKTLEFASEIGSLIAAESSLPEMAAVLRRFKADGVARGEALQVLADLRGRAYDEAEEDRILEVMDVASGFCSPDLAVWD